MGEIKSVKVDNWGVFFLQKLQNFFNKTDYCDLTLQFRDNSQLKVHRLVLSACTDYFNVLEQTCEVVDDAIIMPNGLQADVVVPIVNFMYTGTLEFELKMYNRLLRTAKDMNMTVLLKLLEAHRRTMEMHPPKASGQVSPKPRRRAQATTIASNFANSTGGRSLIQTNQGNKRIVVGASANRPQNRSVSTGNSANRPLPVRQIGSTTFTRIKVENDQQETNTTLPTSGGYSLIKQSNHQQPQQPTSPFEQLRKGYNNNKRPAVASFVSPPAKKPNLEDVKEFAEQQRMRKQIAAEYGDDDYDASNIMDDDTIHNDDDDDEMTSGGQAQSSQATSISAGVQTVASSSSQQTQSEDPPGTTTIIVKHEGPDKPPTIVVKDSSNSKMNHAKIISEVLRQYPHLVRSNKNIKLKIMPNAGGQAQKIIVKKEPMEAEKQLQQPVSKVSNEGRMSEIQQPSAKILASNIVANRPKTMQQQTELSSGKPNMSGAQSSASKTNVGSATTSTQSAAGAPQKRRIDSKTMHALIALGAENVTGPWLCLRCGRNGHPISIPSYRGFRRHLINTHKETIDPALCEHCGWRSASKRELHFHMQLEHKIKTNLYIFPECQLCQKMCIDSDGLNQHLIDSHPDENKQQCIYCNKIFPEELQLYTHMKTFHKKQALEDGIIDYSDDENQTQMDLPPLPPIQYGQDMDQERKVDQQEKKVKILSDISLPIASSIIKTESFAQHTSTVSTEEYLQDQEHDEHNTETKFVAADGSEVILTPEQRKEILSQLNQEHEGSGVVMVLNDSHQQQDIANSEIQSDQGAISQDETSQATTANEEREEEHVAAEDDELHDDNQIYNEMKSLHSNLDDSTTQSEAEGKHGTSLNDEEPHHEQEDTEGEMEHEERAEHLDESKESMDNLEWAENLISEHDLADDVSSQTVKGQKEEIKDDEKSQDEISKKLKELTGDWSEDDEDVTDDERSPEMSPIKESGSKSEKSTTKDADVETEKKETVTEKLAKDQEDNSEFGAHAALLASLQSSTGKDDVLEQKDKLETDEDCENMDEDDIDLALKSLHTGVADGKDHPLQTVDGQQLNENEKKIELVKDQTPVPEENEAENLKAEEEEEAGSKDATTTDEEKPEEKLVKELENINEPEITSSAMEVDEETKKGLIESLLGEPAETMENTATETPGAAETVKSELLKPLEKDKIESNENAMDEENLDDSKVSGNEEFLDNTPDKEITSSVKAEAPISTAVTGSSEAVATEASDEAEASSTKQINAVSSEDQVKSLISEWGDDDEDEDDNDADLTANL